MPRQKRWAKTMWRIAGLVLAGALVLAGCGNDGGDADGNGPAAGSEAGPPEEPVTIRLGYLPSVTGSADYSVMITHPEVTPNRGTWYELEFSEYPGTPPIVQGLATGTLDAGVVGSLTVASGLERGADLVLTAQHVEEREGWGESVWMVRSGEISSAADLKGATVATNQAGSYPDHVADAWISEQAGLVAGEDYEVVEIPFPQMQDALEAGQIDLANLPANFVPRALATGELEILFGATDVHEPMILTLQAFNRDFVEENEAAVKAFLEDFVAATRFVADPDNYTAVVESFAETSGQPVEQLDGYLLTEQDLYRTPEGAIDVELVQRNWVFFADQGAFAGGLNAEDYVVP